MNEKLESAIKSELKQTALNFVKKNNLTITKAAEIANMDVRNFERALKTDVASISRLSELLRKLQVPFNEDELLKSALLKSKVDVQFEKEMSEIALAAKANGKTFLEVVRLVRAYLIKNKSEFGILSDEELEKINKAALLLAAEPIETDFPVTLFRERKDDGFRFFRLDKKDRSLSVSDAVLFGFSKKYGADFFYSDVVVKSLCDEDEILQVEDIITTSGELVWIKE